jgi:hypothetical protein
MLPMSRRFILLTSILALGALAPAQTNQLLPLGEPIRLAGGMGVLNLPFPVSFYDLTVSQLIVTKNGRVAPFGSGLTVSAIPTAAGFFQTPMVCPYWANLEHVGPFGPRVFLHSTATTATITWKDVRPVGSSVEPGTFQLQLTTSFLNDNFRCLYDGPVAHFNAPALVGINGEATPIGVPAPIDFSQAQGTLLQTANDWMYEEFGPGQFDLVGAQSFSLLNLRRYTALFPNPTDVARASLSIESRGASTERGREACEPLRNGPKFEWTPVDVGGVTRYRVQPGLSVGEPDYEYRRGLLIGEGVPDWDQALLAKSTTIAGSTYAALWVSKRGIVVPFSSQADVQFLQAGVSLNEFLLGSAPRIAPLWCEFDTATSVATGGAVYYRDLGNSYSVTWDNWLQEGYTEPNTFQVRVYQGGLIVFSYGKVAIVNQPGPGGLWSEAVVGVSTGVISPWPEAVDLTSLTGPSALAPTVYEYFSPFQTPASTIDLDQLTRLPTRVELTFPSPPMLGTTLSVDTFDPSGAAVGAVYLLGVPSGLFAPPLSLDFLPSLGGCELVNDVLTPGATLVQTTGTPGVPTTLLTIPNVPALTGIRLSASALVLRTGDDVALFPTDEWRVVVGV